MAPSTLETLLLLALPASGKSEVRKYLATLDRDTSARDFHLGPTVQLDDFPYVHMMRQIDRALGELAQPPLFFPAPDKPFRDPRDWGTLIALINEDYSDLVQKRDIKTDVAGEWLLDRFDRARGAVGAASVRTVLRLDLHQKVAAAIDREAAGLLAGKLEGYPDALADKTLVIEFARGGRDDATLPLAPPFGYAHSLSLLDPRILASAAILYVWVTPEQSRRKNQERCDPNDPGSILHHGVPRDVMLNDYGCDDIEFLMDLSDQPGTLRLEAHGEIYHLPIARFDNRTDKTSFVRAPVNAWRRQDVERLHAGLKESLELLQKPRA